MTKFVTMPWKESDRVRLTSQHECYPHFIVPKGSEGTVVFVDFIACGPWSTPEVQVAVKMDEHIEGCEAWDNEVVWYDVPITVVIDALELIQEEA